MNNFIKKRLNLISLKNGEDYHNSRKNLFLINNLQKVFQKTGNQSIYSIGRRGDLFKSFCLVFCLFLLFISSSSFADVRTEFIPSISIAEKYTDNYNQTENNKDDEFSTTYTAGFSFGVIEKTASMFLTYDPGYTDYYDHNENDSWSHRIGLQGQYQISQNTSLTLSERFLRDRSRTARTNSWEDHDTNHTTIELNREFGQKDYFTLDYTYSFDNYDNSNIDEFQTHNPSMSFAYWFTPQFGINLGAEYEKTKFDISNEDPETWSGNIRLLKSITRHFDIFIGYEHTFTDRDSGDHTVYNPFIGFDWRPTKDTGMNIGAGMLFHEWDHQSSEDTNSFFADIDVYKDFMLSRRSTFSITAASGYNPTGDDAASLGFHIYYEAGFLLSYALTKKITGELNGTYTIDQYDNPLVDRNDTTLGAGVDLVWAPLQWLSVIASYSFTDYNTDVRARDDYQENVGMLTITMTPSRSIRFGSSNPRTNLENRLFN